MALDWAAITLTPVGAGDAGRINAWQNDPYLRDLIMGFRGPIQLETTAEWIRSLGGEQNLRSRVVFAVRLTADIKGIAQLQSIDWIQRSAVLGIYIGDSMDRGAGLGFASASLLLDYAFSSLNLERVSLTVLASNEAACRLYERLMFVREGIMRSAYFSKGSREDVAIYGLLNKEWKPALPTSANRLVGS